MACLKLVAAVRGKMWINLPIREFLASKARSLMWAEASKIDQRALEFIIDKVQASIDLNDMLRIKTIQAGALNLNVANTVLVPVPGLSPWNGTNVSRRRGTIFKVNRVIYGTTGTATQLFMSSDLTVAAGFALNLAGTTGFADDVNIHVPETYNFGLQGTANVADASIAIVVLGEYQQIGPNGMDIGGTYLGIYT